MSLRDTPRAQTTPEILNEQLLELKNRIEDNEMQRVGAQSVQEVAYPTLLLTAASFLRIRDPYFGNLNQTIRTSADENFAELVQKKSLSGHMSYICDVCYKESPELLVEMRARLQADLHEMTQESGVSADTDAGELLIELYNHALPESRKKRDRIYGSKNAVRSDFYGRGWRTVQNLFSDNKES
jgi:hypothetical protein